MSPPAGVSCSTLEGSRFRRPLRGTLAVYPDLWRQFSPPGKWGLTLIFPPLKRALSFLGSEKERGSTPVEPLYPPVSSTALTHDDCPHPPAVAPRLLYPRGPRLQAGEKGWWCQGQGAKKTPRGVHLYPATVLHFGGIGR